MDQSQLKQFRLSKLENGRVKIVSGLPDFKVNEDTVILKIICTGICRADIKEVIGARDIPSDRGALFGHELIGEVVCSGNFPFINLSQLVTFNPNITPSRTTGFAEYFLINGTEQELHEAIIPLPISFDLNKLWMPEPFACIVHSLDKYMELSSKKDLDGMNIGILGMGNSGIIFAMYAKFLGAKISIFNRGEERIDFSRSQGLFNDDEIYRLDDHDDHIDSFDIVLVAATKAEPDVLAKAFKTVKDNGYIHNYAGTRKDDKFLDTDIDIDGVRREELSLKINYLKKNITLTGAYGCSRMDFEKAFKLIEEYPDRFPMHKLVSNRFKLDELPEVIMGMASGERDYPGKVLIFP